MGDVRRPQWRRSGRFLPAASSAEDRSSSRGGRSGVHELWRPGHSVDGDQRVAMALGPASSGTSVWPRLAQMCPAPKKFRES